MTVKSIQEAWDEVNKIFPYDYEKNETASKNAGYPIYYSTTSDHQNNWISDLGNRLEVNFEDGRSVNVWVNSEEYHHFEVTVSGKSHNFSYVCSTIYEALDAVVDAGITFNFDVDTTELMLKLASMETDKLISFETHRFGVRRKPGEPLNLSTWYMQQHRMQGGHSVRWLMLLPVSVTTQRMRSAVQKKLLLLLI